MKNKIIILLICFAILILIAPLVPGCQSENKTPTATLTISPTSAFTPTNQPSTATISPPTATPTISPTSAFTPTNQPSTATISPPTATLTISPTGATLTISPGVSNYDDKKLEIDGIIIYRGPYHFGPYKNCLVCHARGER